MFPFLREGIHVTVGLSNNLVLDIPLEYLRGLPLLQMKIYHL
jgi:hypothetical protein